MGSTISCRLSAAVAGKSRRMGKAKRAAAAGAPAESGATSPDDGLIALLAAGLRLQAADNLWRVSGNTLPHRLILRDAGGAWNRLDQCWEFVGDDPTPRLKQALDRLTAQPGNGIGHNSGTPTAAAPHYHGHRGRVRERVLKAGADSLPDYELLELLLFHAIERIDTKPLAKRLLERFGTLGDIFAAEPAQLREFDIDQRTLVLFRALRETARRLAERKVKDMPVLTNWQQLIDYCHTALAHEKTEQFRILFLDRKNVLIADEIQQRGTIDHTPVYPREVVKRALAHNAAALILVHNHPSGDPKPSRDDIEMTKEIAKAAEALGIAIHDHLVIGRKGHASFRSLGLL
jgi:DNA repair protein RadC